MANYVWANRTTIKYSDLIKSPEFAACLKEYPRIKNIMEYNAIDMIASVRSFEHKYIIHDGKIGYVLPEGISHKASYGWKTIFAYFYEKERGTIFLTPEDFVSLSILCCELSYAELPLNFKYIMGVTGTLNILP